MANFFIIREYQAIVFVLQEEINQLRTQLESFRGFDDGDFGLNSALQFSPGNYM
jgi:hypothetical protein